MLFEVAVTANGTMAGAGLDEAGGVIVNVVPSNVAPDKDGTTNALPFEATSPMAGA